MLIEMRLAATSGLMMYRVMGASMQRASGAGVGLQVLAADSCFY